MFHYTAISDVEVDTQLAYILDCIQTDIKALPPSCRPDYVYLGGGYGRGEGGVCLRHDGRKTLYNDLDMFVFTAQASRRRRRDIDAALQDISRHWSAALSLEVDFPPCRNLSRLSQHTHTLMFQELLQGNQLVYGQEDVLAAWPRLDPADIPPLEAYRLMLNRGAGILLAAGRLTQQYATLPDLDFTLRNLHKAVLGCGDALLLQQKRYRYRSQERGELLRQCNPLPGSVLPEIYAMSLLYKARPITEPDCDLPQFWVQVRQLWQDSLLTLLGLARDDEQAAASAQVRAALLRLRGQSPQSSCRQALRWLWHTRQLFPLADLFCDPVLRTLAELYPLLLENHQLKDYIIKISDCASLSYPTFMRLWRLFN
jgi:hypothetical protein